MEVLVGTVKLSSGGTRYKVVEAIKHDGKRSIPGYQKPNLNPYDIAVIRVEGPIQFSDTIQPIKYAIDEVEAGECLQVSGWGELEVSGRFFCHIFYEF